MSRVVSRLINAQTVEEYSDKVYILLAPALFPAPFSFLQRPKQMLGRHLDCKMQSAIHVHCVWGARKQKDVQIALSESVSTCRSCSRCNILIDQGKKPQTQGSACTSIPTLSEATAGFRAPSAIFYCNEGGFLGNWEMVSVYRL